MSRVAEATGAAETNRSTKAPSTSRDPHEYERLDAVTKGDHPLREKLLAFARCARTYPDIHEQGRMWSFARETESSPTAMEEAWHLLHHESNAEVLLWLGHLGRHGIFRHEPLWRRDAAIALVFDARPSERRRAALYAAAVRRNRTEHAVWNAVRHVLLNDPSPRVLVAAVGVSCSARSPEVTDHVSICAYRRLNDPFLRNDVATIIARAKPGVLDAFALFDSARDFAERNDWAQAISRCEWTRIDRTDPRYRRGLAHIYANTRLSQLRSRLVANLRPKLDAAIARDLLATEREPDLRRKLERLITPGRE